MAVLRCRIDGGVDFRGFKLGNDGYGFAGDDFWQGMDRPSFSRSVSLTLLSGTVLASLAGVGHTPDARRFRFLGPHGHRWSSSFGSGRVAWRPRSSPRHPIALERAVWCRDQYDPRPHALFWDGLHRR